MNNTFIDKKQVVANIKKLACFANTPCEVSFIGNGLSSNNLKVTTLDPLKQPTGYYFVKWFGDSTKTSGHEIAAAQRAMQHGLAPKVIYWSAQCLVTDFIHGQTLQCLLSTAPSQLSSAVEQTVLLLARLHLLPASNTEEPFDISSLLTTLTADCHFNAVQLETVNLVLARLPNIEHSKAPVVCHGDANFSNVLVDRNAQHWLIDFECSIFTDAEFDLAMCITINLLDKQLITAMQQIYKQVTNNDIDVTLVNNYLPYCALINALWFIAKAKKSPKTAILLEHAKQQLTWLGAYTAPYMLNRLLIHNT